MAVRLTNTRYRIAKDEYLSNEEKEYLLNKINDSNIDDVMAERGKIVVDKTIFICEYCKEEFKPDSSHRNFIKQKFCCTKHQEIFLNRKRSKTHLGDVRQCKSCGKDYIRNSTLHIYCKKCSTANLSERKKEYKQKMRESKPKKEPRIKVVKVKVNPIKKEKVVLTEEELLKKKLVAKFTRRQKTIDNMTNFFSACKAQIKLNEEIQVHFPEGLDKV